MTIEFLDPTYGEAAAAFMPAARLRDLAGATVGIVSNGKQGTRPFFDALANELIETYGVGDVVHTTKSNYSAPAGPDIVDEARRWNALIAGVGD